MARLKTLTPRLSSAAGRLTGAGRVTPVTPGNPLRHLYSTVRWRRVRWSVLMRDLFTCRMCGRGPQHDHKLLVCDHVEPHRGDEALFWSEPNLQTLCKSPCHDKHKQALEARTRATAGVWT